MGILAFQGKVPVIPDSAFVAPGAWVIGDVVLGEHASVWFNAVLRGDIQPVRIGAESNIQDHGMLHTTYADPVIVGERCTVGHHVNLHGCRVEDECLIGIGAIVLNRAVIGQGSLVGAGALVTEDTIIPPRSLVLGVPAKVVRPLRDDEEDGAHFAGKYIELARAYREG